MLLKLIALVLFGVTGAVCLSEPVPSLASGVLCLALVIVGSAAFIADGLAKTPRNVNVGA